MSAATAPGRVAGALTLTCGSGAVASTACVALGKAPLWTAAMLITATLLFALVHSTFPQESAHRLEWWRAWWHHRAQRRTKRRRLVALPHQRHPVEPPPPHPAADTQASDTLAAEPSLPRPA